MRIHFRETDTSADKALQAWLSWEKIHLQCERPGLGRSLEKGKATHSSILAWRIQFHHLCFEFWLFLLAVYAILDAVLNPSSYWKLQFPTCKMRATTLNMQDYWSYSKRPTQIPIFAHCILGARMQ